MIRIDLNPTQARETARPSPLVFVLFPIGGEKEHIIRCYLSDWRTQHVQTKAKTYYVYSTVS